MTPKRAIDLDLDHSDTHRRVRRRFASAPRSSVASSIPTTPCTPYPSRPSDSPSNPFGRKRTQALTHTLPPPSSFSKHLPLRFQFVRPGASPRLGGIFRVVQVPLSYTFIHLRCLIAFLFGGGYGGDGKHLFEVRKKISMYSTTYKPGQIKGGSTCVKLSSARDPCRYRPEPDDDEVFMPHGEQDGAEAEAEEKQESDTEESEDWIWQAEEDYTLAHAWPKGGDLTRGIIYHHTPTLSVHITINTTAIPRRKGISNTPFVFTARGRVWLFPYSSRPLPRPAFSAPPSKHTMPSRPSYYTRSSSVIGSIVDRDTVTRLPLEGARFDDANADGDTDLEDENEHQDHRIYFSENDTEEEERERDETDEEDANASLPSDTWNAPDAFATYLNLVHRYGRINTSEENESSNDESDHDDDDHTNTTSASDASIPSLTHSFSSSPVSSSPFPTSPISAHISTLSASSSKLPYSSYISSSSSNPSFYSSYLYPTSAYTPAPAHAPWQRRRIERVQRRMERLKKGAWLCVHDEEEEAGVDELGDDKEGEEDKFVRPVLAPGEVWDPFGDEYEV